MVNYGAIFVKRYLPAADIVRLLESRGLGFNDRKKAAHYLDNIGYYRLSAYFYPFLKKPKERQLFKTGSTFEKAVRIYRFDKKLRMLIFNEIEKIEVAFRSTLVKVGCEETGDPFWMTDPANFISPAKFSRTTGLIDDELKRSKEEFIDHFRNTYSNPYPPAWMLTEIMSFGVIYNAYSNIRNKMIKKRISKSFGLQMKPFESWMTVLTLTRNACCHHARIWNKQNTTRPMTPNKIALPWITLQTDPMHIYYNLCIIKYFLNIISPDNDMKDKLLNLFAEYQKLDILPMGFPAGWQSEPIWL